MPQGVGGGKKTQPGRRDRSLEKASRLLEAWVWRVQGTPCASHRGQVSMPLGSKWRCWRRWGTGLLTHRPDAKEAISLGEGCYSPGETFFMEQASFYVPRLFAEARGAGGGGVGRGREGESTQCIRRARPGAGCDREGQPKEGFCTFSGCLWARPELQVPKSRILVIGFLPINRSG